MSYCAHLLSRNLRGDAGQQLIRKDPLPVGEKLLQGCMRLWSSVPDTHKYLHREEDKSLQVRHMLSGYKQKWLKLQGLLNCANTACMPVAGTCLWKVAGENGDIWLADILNDAVHQVERAELVLRRALQHKGDNHTP